MTSYVWSLTTAAKVLSPTTTVKTSTSKNRDVYMAIPKQCKRVLLKAVKSDESKLSDRATKWSRNLVIKYITGEVLAHWDKLRTKMRQIENYSSTIIFVIQRRNNLQYQQVFEAKSTSETLDKRKNLVSQQNSEMGYDGKLKKRRRQM